MENEYRKKKDLFFRGYLEGIEKKLKEYKKVAREGMIGYQEGYIVAFERQGKASRRTQLQAGAMLDERREIEHEKKYTGKVREWKPNPREN